MKRPFLGLVALALLVLPGCGVLVKPFEPNKFETISPNEVGFLIPLTGDASKQRSSAEDAGKVPLTARQVRLPQRWVADGYQPVFYNGHYVDDAVLIKVDMSPVTREWTAEKDRGSSDKDQAIWVQTSDPVELSTGWTITAQIATPEDAVTFLHYYRADSLANVLDHDVRSKIQSVFGLEVTDIPLDKLRSAATPHIKNTVTSVTEFFKKRGVTITNLGITGGFVFKNETIATKVAEVYKAEQDKAIAIAETAAQKERNNKIQLSAESKSKAILTEKEAEAKGIEAVTAARKKEMEAAGTNVQAYANLKQIEVLRALAEKWNGTLPVHYFGGGTAPNFLMTLPATPAAK